MNSFEQRLMDTYHYLHAHPETAFQEVKTTAFLKRTLEECGVHTVTFDDTTGVIGTYGNFDGMRPVVGIRADIDALWQEVDGVSQPNHSCGHDANMTIVLGVLWRLLENPSMKNKVAVKFIFQPAEEIGLGALKMIEKGVLDDLDYLFGIHLRPADETEFGKAAPAIVHGAAKNIEGHIFGEDAHGARPLLNKNAIEIGAEIVRLLKELRLETNIPYSVKMTSFQAGGKSPNIIPGNATFALDLRAQTNDIMAQLTEQTVHIMEEVKQKYNTDIQWRELDSLPAAILNEEAIDVMGKSISEIIGEENLNKPIISPGGDDFHFYTVKNPSLKATMLGLGCDLKPGLHHPNMNFNKKALPVGVNILYRAVLNVYGL